MSDPAAPAASAEGVRLDVWLWAARFFKTRPLAKDAVGGGKVEVAALATRRGPAAAAQLLYRETEASRAAREEAATQRRLTAAGEGRPRTKPDKRARRLIRALGDIDAS
jgi:ribosome-associated heat shock protein Hsp15